MWHGELRSDRGSRLVSKFFLQFSFFNISDTFKTRKWSPISSSSSSTSPTTTVLSDSETREREDLSGIDSHPVFVSSSHVERDQAGWPWSVGVLLPNDLVIFGFFIMSRYFGFDVSKNNSLSHQYHRFPRSILMALKFFANILLPLLRRHWADWQKE